MRDGAKALDALAKAVKEGSSRKIEKALTKLQSLEASTPGLSEWLALGRAWLEQESLGRRQKLSAELKASCAAENIEILVLGREPLVLRLPPVTVAMDFAKNKAEIRFAEETLGTCEIESGAILKARKAALTILESSNWNPTAYRSQLFEAWRRAARGSEDWVELTDVLPEIALLVQSRKFRKDPTARNYQPYTRARFAYDLWRLRRDRVLSGDGRRLTLGPATGGSTRDKSRVIFLEDARGAGQYHLTLRFVKDESHAE